MGSKILALFLTTATYSNIENSVFLDNATVATVVTSDKRKSDKNVSNFKPNYCLWYLLIEKIVGHNM